MVNLARHAKEESTPVFGSSWIQVLYSGPAEDLLVPLAVCQMPMLPNGMPPTHSASPLPEFEDTLAHHSTLHFFIREGEKWWKQADKSWAVSTHLLSEGTKGTV